MKYTVQWQQAAEDDLTKLWLEAADRQEVSRVSLEIDRRLEKDAHLQGESREGRRRILFVEGFAVAFEADQTDRIAKVLGIWRISR